MERASLASSGDRKLEATNHHCKTWLRFDRRQQLQLATFAYLCIYIRRVYLYYSVLIYKLQSNFIKLRSPILEVLQRNQVKYNNTL